MGIGLAISNLPKGLDRPAVPQSTRYPLREVHTSRLLPVTKIADLHEEFPDRREPEIIDYRCLELGVSHPDARPGVAAYERAATSQGAVPEKGSFISIYA